ncbi:BspA family leucine-rich repeat surface protein [Mycoplasma mycoides subsp. capri]|uniref:BspA family leucine-rich repeat surface protein n=1 Tax=Mycoplasma mycoides TaxID=2102 RepID=UPI00224083A6|nr:BspA family leucine-rich repeat surface protein [Mycoplasma mycoides]UZK64099.1 BspA family leucine-rich repeat surface protein [Mycoplasma mycoides subsp. capri]
MKKLLTILGSIGLIATTSAAVIACDDKNQQKNLTKSKLDEKFKKEEKHNKSDNTNSESSTKISQKDNKNDSKTNFSNGVKNNILSNIEDENLFIYGYDKWLKDSKNGKSEHFINPKNPNEILLLGYTKETKGKKDTYKLNSIPSNINKVPKSLPTKITSLEAAFKDNVNEIIDGIESWDTSRITNMNRTFYDAKKFNGDISKWNTNNVEDMTYMFFNAESFKGDLSKWKVPKSFYSNTFDKYSGIQDKTNLFPKFKK